MSYVDKVMFCWESWCSRKNTALSAPPRHDVHIPVSRICEYVTLHGKKNFVDMIKVVWLLRSVASVMSNSLQPYGL